MNQVGFNRPLKDLREEQEQFRKRAWIGFLGVLVVTVLLLGRYFYLQVFAHEDYSTRSNSNRVQVQPVPPNRGLIYDRRGRIIADNQPAYRLQVVPEQAGDLEAVFGRLSEVIRLSEEDLARFERTRGRYREFESVPLRFNLSEGEVSRFSVNQHRFPGIKLVPYLSRNYPYGELLTHVLGYVGRLDEKDLQAVDASNYRGTTHIGKLGIEKSYESQLHGVTGLQRVETNARGRVLEVLEREDPKAGSDLVLSVDVRVQQAAWDALGDRAGSVVAIDPRDGAVIAMVSKPSFDPNLFVHGIRQADYQAILSQPLRPLFNRALAGGYEPGSTMKPFVGLGGLELEVIPREHRYFSNGQYFLPNYSRPFGDWKDGGHGWVDMRGALEESVNGFFYELAYKMGIDQLHDYLQQFGFGARTGIDVPGESTGLLPSRAWKESRYSEPWYPGETVIAGIGQGFNVVTPLQLAHALATLVSEGQRLVPRLVYAIKRQDQENAETLQSQELPPVPVSDPENWNLVREGMRRVVNGARGTARDVSLNADYEIAGKTGTAQVFALARDQEYEASELDESLRDHALFIAYAPFTEPRIVVSVVVDNGGAGSRIAAPIARATLDAWLQQEVSP